MIHEKIEIHVPGSEMTAELTTYIWDNSEELYDGLLRPIVLVLPGGGYMMTSDREAENLAIRFMNMGCHAAVLHYSVAPAQYPVALLQAAAAIRCLREHAKEWYIDAERVIIQGSSAGGHLAANLGTSWKKGPAAQLLATLPEMIRPNAMILSYPVITTGEYSHRGSFENLLGEDLEHRAKALSLENQVDADTPKCFIWCTFDDQSVPCENSIEFVRALRRADVPVEFHMFAHGKHGLGTADRLSLSKDGHGVQLECAVWTDMAMNWIDNL